ncbi:MAG: Hsp20/alpha crystallin family protein [Candidatus Heimdallarchaeota archaeon]
MNKRNDEKKAKKEAVESIRESLMSLAGDLKSRIDSQLEKESLSLSVPTDSLRNFEQKCLSPLVDLIEDTEQITITADLPCAVKEKIKIQTTDNSINFEAGLIHDIKFASGFRFQQDTAFKCYRKTIKLPTKIDPNSVRATYIRGILTITAQKIGKRVNIPIE